MSTRLTAGFFIMVSCLWLALSVQTLRAADSPATLDLRGVYELLDYPADALRNGLEGKVTLSITVSPSGKVGNIEVKEADLQMFANAAIEAVRRTKHNPAVKNGKKIKSAIRATIYFVADRKLGADPDKIEAAYNAAHTQASSEPGENQDKDIKSAEKVYQDDDDNFLIGENEPTFDFEELAKNIIYPRKLSKAGKDGKVVLRVFINKQGKPGKIKVISSPDKLFTSAAEYAVLHTGFKPASFNGNPRGCWLEIPIVFKIEPKKKK